MRRHLVLAAALAVGLAACGGSGGSEPVVTRTVAVPSTTTQSSPAPTTQATTPSTTPTTTTSTTPTTTTSAATGAQACVARDLTLSVLGQQGAAGHGEIGFALKNTSSAPCHTYGFPGILFLDRSGAPLATIPHRTTTDFVGHAPAVKLLIAPGQEVSFRLGVTHGAVPGSVCSTAFGLQVIPPDDTASIRTTIPGGAYECRDATVSPLQPGPTAYR